MAEETTAAKLEEVKPLKEPMRGPEHCGKPMRKLSGIGTVGVVTVYICAAECGHQLKVREDDGRPRP